MIILATIIVLIILFFRIMRKIYIHKKTINMAIEAINTNYINLFIDGTISVRLLQCFMIIFSEIFSFIIIYKLILNYFNTDIVWKISIYTNALFYGVYHAYYL